MALLQHTETLLNFWRDNFSLDDFKILVNMVDKIVCNQKILNKFLLIKSNDQRISTQLIMHIKNIVGLIYCQTLSNAIDVNNSRTKLFTSTHLQPDLFAQTKHICSSLHTKITLTNANVICICNNDLIIDKTIEMRAIIINMI